MKQSTEQLIGTDLPLAFRYQRLLVELVKIDQHLAESGDQLQSAAAAVYAINEFLRDDAAVRNSGIGKSLRVLVDQMTDAYSGVKDTMFNRGGGRGRPTGRAQDRQRGMLIFALNLLIGAGMNNREASSYLEKIANNAGLKSGGKQITWKKLQQWREQVADTSPKDTDDMVKRLGVNMPVNTDSIGDAKTAAATFVEVIARRSSN